MIFLMDLACESLLLKAYIANSFLTARRCRDQPVLELTHPPRGSARCSASKTVDILEKWLIHPHWVGGPDFAARRWYVSDLLVSRCPTIAPHTPAHSSTPSAARARSIRTPACRISQIGGGETASPGTARAKIARLRPARFTKSAYGPNTPTLRDIASTALSAEPRAGIAAARQ